MFKIVFISAILNLLVSLPVGADESICESKNYSLSGYIHPQRGKVVVYTTPSEYIITPEDLVCAAIKQFWAHKDVFPKKLTIMVVSDNYMDAMIMQINLKASVMLITTVNLPKDTHSVKTVWTMFPEPMKRFTEMVRNEELPLATKHQTKANYVTVTRKDLIYLAAGYSQQNSYTITITRPVPNGKQEQ